MAWQSLRRVSPRPGPSAFGVPEDLLGGRGPPSGDFEILGAASLRSLQGCGFLINERNRFLDLFYKWERSQNGDPSKNEAVKKPSSWISATLAFENLSIRSSTRDLLGPKIHFASQAKQ